MVAFFDPSTATWSGQQEIFSRSSDTEFLDKPWLVRGAANEFYVIAYDSPDSPSDSSTRGFVCLRSTNGGAAWTPATDSRVPVAIGSQRVLSPRFCGYIAGGGASPLILTYIHEATDGGSATIRFLKATDDNSNPSAPAVSWEQIMCYPCSSGPGMGPQGGDPAPLELITKRDTVETMVPRGGAWGSRPAGFFPWVRIAADATNADRYYLAYHDTATTGATDKNCNVYVQRLTRNAESGYWSLSTRVNVAPHSYNPNDPTTDKDQWLPALNVDEDGRVHVAYYDDRAYASQPDCAYNSDPDKGCTTLFKYDVYYSYSTDQGATFTNCELADGGACGDAASVTALDFSHTPLSGAFCPGEYIDIGVDGDNVWIAYPSTEPTNPGGINADRSVIRANRVTW